MTQVSNKFGVPEIGYPIELPPPETLSRPAPMELPPPGHFPRIRAHLDPLTQAMKENRATGAVLLGIAAIPAVSMSFFTSSPADAQTIIRDTAAAERIAASVLTERSATRAQDPHERELKEKVGRLVQRQFGGSHQAAFNHYAGADGQVNRDELRDLLGDAGIGNFFTRGAWVDGIMEKIDGPPNGNNNGRISWAEFQRVMR